MRWMNYIFGKKQVIPLRKTEFMLNILVYTYKMYWVYILECENNYFYVGETRRLYRRFWEHLNGEGGINTSIYRPKSIVAIYPVNRLGKFLYYNQKVISNDYNLHYNIYFNRGGILEGFNYYDEWGNNSYFSKYVENTIVEKMMITDKDNWEKIRGGEYVRFTMEYTFPKNEIVEDLPICNCGLPCDVKQNEKHGYLYFRCAKKNMWDDFCKEFFTEISNNPCKFFMKYTKDLEYKINYENTKQKIKQLTSKSYWLKELLGGTYQYCIGGCGKEYDEDYTIRYSRKSINLCFDCFINKNEELRKKYEKNSEPECILSMTDIMEWNEV